MQIAPGHTLFVTKEFITITSSRAGWHLWFWDWLHPTIHRDEVQAVMAMQRVIKPVRR